VLSHAKLPPLVQIWYYPLDMRGATTDDYKQLADTIDDVFGGLHGIAHCAATLGQISPIDQIDAKTWQETFAVNLHAPVLLTQALLPLLRKTGNGGIVFTTDNKTTAYWGAYGISKASVISAMRIQTNWIPRLTPRKTSQKQATVLPATQSTRARCEQT